MFSPAQLRQFQELLDRRDAALIPKLASEIRNAGKSGRGIVIALHGINTRGEWQKAIATPISEAGFTPVLLDYGHYRIYWIALPWVRAKKLRWFLDEYTRLREKYKDESISIIAHSFGTYLLAQTMEKYIDVRLDQIILCGSIVRRTFPWNRLLESGQAKRVLNDTGGLDMPVRISVTAAPNMGTSGVHGFKKTHPRLVQRRFAKYGHSDYFTPLHFRNHWIPFLSGGEPGPTAVDDNEPVNWLFYIGWTIAFAIMGLVVWVCWGSFAGMASAAINWLAR